MKILILGLNYAPEYISTGIYSTGLAQGLVERGAQVSVVCANPYYPQWRTWDGYRGKLWSQTNENGVDITRCSIYVPASPSLLKRLAHYLSFFISSIGPLLWRALKERPDYIIMVAPTIINAPAVWLAGKLSGAKTWVHVQDFEVGAGMATGLLDAGNIVGRLAIWTEKTLLSLFDQASTISPGMCKRMNTLRAGRRPTYELRNWANIAHIQYLTEPSPYRKEWNIDAPYVLLYSGNIAFKQGIEIVVDAAKQLKHRGDIQFVICGDGPYRAQLIDMVKDLGNVQVNPLQPVERLNQLLSLATIHLLPQKAEVADSVLPSKLTNMLASGRPIIVTAEADMDLAAETRGCGVAVPPGDVAAFSAAIEQLLDAPERRLEYSKASRRRAEEIWDRENILDRLFDFLAAKA